MLLSPKLLWRFLLLATPPTYGIKTPYTPLNDAAGATVTGENQINTNSRHCLGGLRNRVFGLFATIAGIVGLSKFLEIEVQTEELQPTSNTRLILINHTEDSDDAAPPTIISAPLSLDIPFPERSGNDYTYQCPYGLHHKEMFAADISLKDFYPGFIKQQASSSADSSSDSPGSSSGFCHNARVQLCVKGSSNQYAAALHLHSVKFLGDAEFLRTSSTRLTVRCYPGTLIGRVFYDEDFSPERLLAPGPLNYTPDAYRVMFDGESGGSGPLEAVVSARELGVLGGNDSSSSSTAVVVEYGKFHELVGGLVLNGDETDGPGRWRRDYESSIKTSNNNIQNMIDIRYRNLDEIIMQGCLPVEAFQGCGPDSIWSGSSRADGRGDGDLVAGIENGSLANLSWPVLEPNRGVYLVQSFAGGGE